MSSDVKINGVGEFSMYAFTTSSSTPDFARVIRSSALAAVPLDTAIASSMNGTIIV
jgi:hypothetical protein